MGQRSFGQLPRKRCQYCKRSRPTYLLASHEEHCAREQNERQAIRQRELLEELARLQGRD